MEDLKKFYKNKSKKPELYTYDDKGNLVEYNKDGGIVKTIALPQYRPITSEELQEIENKRIEAITVASNAFDEARTRLYDEFKKLEYNDSDIFRLNREVALADARLQSIRFPHIYIDHADKVEIRSLDFTQPSEVRKYAYPIAFYKTNPFQLTEQYTRIGVTEQLPVPLSVIKEKPRQILLFQDPDTNTYGFLSLDWSSTLTYNSTVYHSAKQAIAAELAKEFNDQEHLTAIMKAEKPSDITYSVTDVPGDKDANEIRWNNVIQRLILDINVIKFNSYPELKERLLQTDNAVLGAYVPNDNLLGIGIALDNKDSMVQTKWTGQNLLGKALMDIRTKIQSDLAVASQGVKPKRKRPTVASSSAKQIQAVPGLYYKDNAVIDGDAVINSLDIKGGWQSVGTGASSRKVQQYGYLYNYKSKKITEKVEDIPEFLIQLRDILQTECRSLQIIDQLYEFNQCLVNDYQPGQGISNHIDSNDFGAVIGCFTLGSGATMNFKKGAEKQSIYVKPNSLYIMSGDARYVWSHEMSSVMSNMVDAIKIPRARRISVTFRHVPVAQPTVLNSIASTATSTLKSIISAVAPAAAVTKTAANQL